MGDLFSDAWDHPTDLCPFCKKGKRVWIADFTCCLKCWLEMNKKKASSSNG